MVIRRGGNLDLARRGEPPVGRHHAAHDLTLLFAHLALVVQGEVAPALDPAAHLRIIALELFVEPGALRRARRSAGSGRSCAPDRSRTSVAAGSRARRRRAARPVSKPDRETGRGPGPRRTLPPGPSWRAPG